MSEKNMTIDRMVLELGRIAASQALSAEAREAARRAEEVVRGLRSSLELRWETPVAELHAISVNVRPNEYLARLGIAQ